MSKIKVCKHTLNYRDLIRILKDNEIEFKTKDCLHKCSKCHEKVLVKKGDKYISAKNVENLIEKLSKV
ncbi:hypothetical protein [Clostridium luticellarii]|jgi:uncharacterized protein YuzB (UPF0349 family)|uniref:DUF1450 domain-containing protein n=1 Tax=Clostridium luticellarii TaxID=1691940 RepID=A0A2T0BAA0_9CLOT|nr:hypothetical protein [Clostridium luticellarii]MCI1945184.1 hypothetical protein [Clostridium luticellarii]MCI1968854.1 hypothetical protein [Clostridium luticellarii]MCI1995640.1 hypothetical protein [Clostridium luticellarii]MCI2040028.1 hypothetical protein [Clostridium luticellarii]PRR80727.1 hypothetical protein CLLU_33170 [Clostridium luticellarii]